MAVVAPGGYSGHLQPEQAGWRSPGHCPIPGAKVSEGTEVTCGGEPESQQPFSCFQTDIERTSRQVIHQLTLFPL